MCIRDRELADKSRNVLDVLQEIGHMPLPPYIDRPDEEADQECYQTVYNMSLIHIWRHQQQVCILMMSFYKNYTKKALILNLWRYT